MDRREYPSLRSDDSERSITARAAYQYSLDYAKAQAVRAQDPAIAFTLARIKMEIDAARLLVRRASWMGRSQVPFK